LAGAAPVGRSWRERVGDPAEPLYTIAVAIDLLGTTHHTLRRLESALDFAGSRPSGNQRRYSLEDLEVLSSACALSDQGLSPLVVARILEERRRDGDEGPGRRGGD
jgi:DNA-binding transcriptional MerR regulator